MRVMLHHKITVVIKTIINIGNLNNEILNEIVTTNYLSLKNNLHS